MKITNVNSKYEIDGFQQDFIQKIVECADSRPIGFYDTLVTLAMEIPIYLFNEVSMPSITIQEWT